VIRTVGEESDNYSERHCEWQRIQLMERKFAPPEERLRSLIAREKLMPKDVLAAARESEESAARLYRDRDRAVARDYQLLSA
jgi:hypothetical protein